MRFDSALKKMLNDGETVQRDGWHIQQYIRVYEGEAILLHARGGWGIWKPKAEDLLASDWVIWRPLVNPQAGLDFNAQKKAASERDHVPMPDNLRDALLDQKSKGEN